MAYVYRKEGAVGGNTSTGNSEAAKLAAEKRQQAAREAAARAAAARKAAAERQAKINSLKKQIGELEDKITMLDEEIQQYEEMNAGIGGVIGTLESAKNSLVSSGGKLQEAYTGTTAKQENIKFDTVSSQIGGIISKLGTALQQSNSIIKDKELEITKIQIRIDSLNKTLLSL